MDDLQLSVYRLVDFSKPFSMIDRTADRTATYPIPRDMT